ncbi:ExeA family protein [Thalassolituus alkanivorans]|uniref:ExeA family protein n=1 Tax=Thalassolituus alkanivorans TaxID=2881055 RepID=UPI001E5F4ACB|nr:AAA family ATPase [Thalassolituus alkanivorans]MCB2388531.1 AAA family ATPase [Thalassolituus alkanivorans]MCB2423751.1 AAA family ATPase [Thalassolituus alkanivorans]
MDMTQLTQACEQFYGLKQPPFGLTPNTEFYVELPSQKQAFELLLFALSSGEGFIKVTGEVGTGKTLLCRRLLNALSVDGVRTAYIPNPALGAEGLWRAIACELGLNTENKSDLQVQEDIQQCLLQFALNAQPVVLIIDEAQCMPEDTLEALRLISNLETERQKLVQIVLFGQPELNLTLAQPRFRQLLQRITYSADLRPLNNSEALAVYLQQRLSIAGYRGMPLFQASALKHLWQASRGIPRLVNILAAKTLLVGYGNGSHQLESRHVAKAVADTEGAYPSAPDWSWLRLSTLFAAVVLVLI